MSREEIFEIIARHAREIVPRLQNHDFKPTDSLRDLGANSVDRADIIMMTLEVLSLDIPLPMMGNAKNMGELAGIIHENA